MAEKDLFERIIENRWTRRMAVASLPFLFFSALNEASKSKRTYSIIQPSAYQEARELMPEGSNDLDGDGVDDLLMFTPSRVVPMYGVKTENGVIYERGGSLLRPALHQQADYAKIKRKLNR